MKPATLLRYIRTTLVQNVLSLFGLQVVNYLLPLALVPYLARVLGAAGLGRVAFTQGFAAYLMLLVEYGFEYSGTREVARHRNEPERVNAIVAGTVGAKVLMSLGVIGASVLLQRLIPMFRSHPALLWAGLFFAVARGHSMVWYFQGVERMKLVAILDGIAKVSAAAAIFMVVRTPSDDWKVVALQGAGAAVAMVLSFVLALREVSFSIPGWGAVFGALRTGWTMFVFRGSVSLYTAGNAFILGLFVPATYVGYYSGAERIIRAGVGLMMPVTRAVYPRISSLVGEKYGEARRIMRISLFVMVAGGTLLGVGAAIFAPWIVRTFLGRGYAPAADVLRVLAVLPVLVGISNVLGVQWMLPLGMDRTFNRIIIGAGLLNLLLAAILAPAFQQMGMATAVVCAEMVATLGMALALRGHVRPQLRSTPTNPEVRA